MLDITLHVTLALEGPILTQSAGPGALGVDAVMARDPAGVAYFPYSHIKGRLLEACEQLKALAPSAWDFDFAAWFGTRSGNRATPEARDLSFDPIRTRLSFTDFREVGASALRDELRVRVRIDPDLGAAEEHMLAMIESSYHAGQDVIFAGDIRYLASNEADAARVADRLERAFHWVHSYGAERTIGFGKCHRVTVERVDRPVTIPASPTMAAVQLHYALTPATPFCVTESRVGADNLFVSSSVIPGGVLKGALASGWAQLLGKPGQPVEPGFDPDREALSKHFSAIRFRHARPVADADPRDGIVPPLSFAKVGTSTFRDLALEADPEPKDGFAIAFAPDWKPQDHELVDQYFGQAQPKTELRVRTKIDRASRRAQTAMLFAYESIRPEGFRWHTTIDLDQVPAKDRPAVTAQLTALLESGLRGLGKTKTFFTATPIAQPATPAIAHGAGNDDVYIVTLQTPCLLANSAELVGERAPEDLHAAYRKAWHDLSGNSLDVVRYYAQQSLQGGLYLYKRFQQGNNKPYMPYLLTNAGSVFVLKSTDASKARSHIEQWRKTGLPAPAWARNRFSRNGQDGAHWSNQPYVPENGFGEIVVNLAIHESPAIELKSQEAAHV